MARIRTIKPEFWTSEQVVECSTNARLFFIGIWNFVDDRGVHPFSLRALKMRIFPGDSFSLEQIQGWFDELLQHRLVRLFSVGEEQYFVVTGWHHQKIDRPSFKYPEPSEFDDESTNDPRTIVDGHPPEGKGEEGRGREGSIHAHSSNASECRVPEDLIEFCHRWNAWHDAGIVKSCILDPQAPGETVQKKWQSAQRDREQRERLQDLDAIQSAIAKSQAFLRGPDCKWLTPANLIGGKNTNRIWYLEQLLSGVYADRKTGSTVRASQPGRPEHSEAADIWPEVIRFCVDARTTDPEYPTKLSQRFGNAVADSVLKIKVATIKNAADKRAAGNDFPLKELGIQFRHLLHQYQSEEAAHAAT